MSMAIDRTRGLFDRFARLSVRDKYSSYIGRSNTTDEVIVEAIENESATDSLLQRAERRLDWELMLASDPMPRLLRAFDECCADLDKRRAHADTAPQHVPVDQLTTWQRQHLGDWVPLREPVPCVADTGRRYARIDLAKLTKGQASPGYGQVTIDIAGTPLTIKADPTVPPNGMRMVSADGRTVTYKGSFGDTVTLRLRSEAPEAPIDPLDVEYDGWTLRDLLRMDEKRRNSDNVIAAVTCSCFTPAQRAAISAHWSAELRAKVDATKQTECEQVVSDYDEDRP